MNLEQRVDAALFRHLLDGSSLPLIGSVLGSTLVGIALWQSSENVHVIGWVCAVYAATAIRLLLSRVCLLRLRTSGYDRNQALRYALSTGISGIAWGLCALLITDADTLAQVITITSIQAMIMGGVVTLGAFLPSFLAFSIPAILPMIIVLSQKNGTLGLVLSVYNFVFFLLMVSIALRFNKSLRETRQLAIENEDLVKALTEAKQHLTLLAETDGLTEVPNRRSFDAMLESEFARLSRSGVPLSLIFLDVDHFKLFNDTYGHIVGDQCLKRIAQVFQGNFHRAPDFAARYGGEEFAGILPETDHEGALLLAEKIRTDIAALTIPHSASPTHHHITVSLGVVTVDCSKIGSVEDALAMADRQLYRAKSEGRNRIAARNAVLSK